MSWLLAFLGFALLIIFHELGHFSAAKAVGMRVEKFSLFFGAPIAKIQRGETQYAIGTIPLGGYVKITGMSPDEAAELPPELFARSYAGSPVWKRLVVIAAGPFVNLVIAFVLLLGIVTIHGRAVDGIAVSQIQTGYSAKTVLQDNDRLAKVTAAATTTSPAKTVLGDEPGVSNAELDKRQAAMIALISTGGCNAKPLGTQYKGDGPPYTPEYAECANPQPLQVTVRRDGVLKTVPVTPKYDPVRKRYRLGLSFAYPIEKTGIIDGAGASVSQMWFITRETVTAIAKIVYNKQARHEVSSVVGGYETTRQSFEVSTAQALTVIALISLSLA
ncbi:MAG: site-2 protease family protein, partial [Patulibacter sp.]|nr:site-2 protease family protein [Patulibacter sp.]